MKSYLYAPVVIAGLFTVSGTASIATAELHLVRTGQQVASMLEIRPRQSSDLDQRQLDAYNFERDSARQLRDSIRLGNLSAIPADTEPAPVVDLKVTPESHECPNVPRAHSTRSHPSRTSVSQASLTSRYSYTALPIAPNAPRNNAAVFLKVGSPRPFVNLASFKVGGKDAARWELAFHAKEFAERQKEFATAVQKSSFTEWNKKQTLKSLPVYEMTIETGDGKPSQVITIDPAKLASDAEKLSGSNDTLPAPDKDDHAIATPSH